MKQLMVLMAHSTLRIGLIGAGANMKVRHIPGLRALPDVEIVGVCNRRPGSTQAVAREFAIPRTFDNWHDLVSDPGIDAIVIGTWPYLHCPITLEALAAGKHVLTEARLSLNAAEAHKMLEASGKHAGLICQVVPSPFGLRGNEVMVDLMKQGYVGELREVHVCSLNDSLADPAAPLSWRQDAALSGFNMLHLGILHETLHRWVPATVRVLAQVHAFIPTRIDPESGVRRPVGTPDSVQALAVLETDVRVVYRLSGVTRVGHGMGIHLYGTEGMLHYDLMADRIWGTRRPQNIEEVPIPATARGWRVEADFVDSIRARAPVRFTDFATGVAYMEFTEAVARSAQRSEAVELPLAELWS